MRASIDSSIQVMLSIGIRLFFAAHTLLNIIVNFLNVCLKPSYNNSIPALIYPVLCQTIFLYTYIILCIILKYAFDCLMEVFR